jgi:hypothetical protein
MSLAGIFKSRYFAGAVACGALCVAGVGLDAHLRRQPGTPTDVPVQVDFNASISNSLLVVTYTVTNRTTAPILVLDQMGDDSHRDDAGHPPPDADWAYVDFVSEGWSLHGRKLGVILSRRQSEQGDLPCYFAVVPNAHLLSAGTALSGEFHRTLPLRRNPSHGGHIRSFGDTDSLGVADFDDIELQIGWMADVPVLSAEQAKSFVTTSAKGETIWHLNYASYDVIRAAQQIASSARRPMDRQGEDSR